MVQENKKYCSARIWGQSAFHPSTCGRPVKFTVGGKDYCTIHNPSYVEKKYKERFAKFEAERKARHEAWERETAVKEYCANLSTEELKKRIEEGHLPR